MTSGSEVRIETLDFDEAYRASLQLAAAVSESGFDADGVLGIATGGVMPALIVGEALGLPVSTIRITRPLTGLKRMVPLRHLPHSGKQFLRRMEMATGLYRALSRRQVVGSLEPAPKRPVVIDDSLDTGATMIELLRRLQRQGVKRDAVLVAVLTQMYSTSRVTADIAVFQLRNLSFPWSRDSHDYARFLDYCKQRNAPEQRWR